MRNLPLLFALVTCLSGCVFTQHEHYHKTVMECERPCCIEVRPEPECSGVVFSSIGNPE